MNLYPFKRAVSNSPLNIPEGMSTKKNIVVSGVAALGLAVLIIAAMMLAGVQLYTVPVPGGTTTQGTQGSQGVLSILITDPPNVPEGVTAVYISYSDLSVHVAGAGNESGWKVIKQSGTIELMGTVNISQTIASVNIESGKYNLLRFNITSAKVTFNGKNYTAFVPSSMLTVPIIGGIEVNNSKPSATIIDITPTVFNIGSESNPEFMIKPVAKAFPVPSNAVTQEVQREGFRMRLSDKLWWKNIRQSFTANLRITSASLSQDSLSVTVMNSGNSSTEIKLIVVTPLATALRGQMKHFVPSTFLGAAVFLVEKNGTLVPLQKLFASAIERGEIKKVFTDVLSNLGYTLAPAQSKTFTYSGQITMSIAMKNLPARLVVPNQQYLITVVGTEALASYVVVAA